MPKLLTSMITREIMDIALPNIREVRKIEWLTKAKNVIIIAVLILLMIAIVIFDEITILEKVMYISVTLVGAIIYFLSNCKSEIKLLLKIGYTFFSILAMICIILGDATQKNKLKALFILGILYAVANIVSKLPSDE